MLASAMKQAATAYRELSRLQMLTLHKGCSPAGERCDVVLLQDVIPVVQQHLLQQGGQRHTDLCHLRCPGRSADGLARLTGERNIYSKSSAGCCPSDCSKPQASFRLLHSACIKVAPGRPGCDCYNTTIGTEGPEPYLLMFAVPRDQLCFALLFGPLWLFFGRLVFAEIDLGQLGIEGHQALLLDPFVKALVPPLPVSGRN